MDDLDLDECPPIPVCRRPVVEPYLAPFSLAVTSLLLVHCPVFIALPWESLRAECKGQCSSARYKWSQRAAHVGAA